MVIKSLGFVVKLCGSKFWFSLLAAVLFWESLFNLSVPQFSHLEIGANNNTHLAGSLRRFSEMIKVHGEKGG